MLFPDLFPFRAEPQEGDRRPDNSLVSSVAGYYFWAVIPKKQLSSARSTRETKKGQKITLNVNGSHRH
jgi:hypothetical protein